MAAAHDDDNITFGVLFHAYITAVEEEENQPERRTRRAAVRQFWVRPWLTEVNRQQFGHFSSLLDTQLRIDDPVAFQRYTRLTPEL